MVVGFRVKVNSLKNNIKIYLIKVVKKRIKRKGVFTVIYREFSSIFAGGNAIGALKLINKIVILSETKFINF